MKDEKRPVVIDGKTYLVDRTFSDHPAIYKVIAKGTLEHVDGNSHQTSLKTIEESLKPGQVIIIAHIA